ncbi:CHAT domain-containing protein [Aerosakkonemataceae cyanobacterium BLCC-F154]|uniref:CHAT domain-containing protein n=1 Tax=Floridaenema fluviatile BLCC-F154 TaxID=3153640 RepID=A0ABV4YCS0_9CYAN
MYQAGQITDAIKLWQQANTAFTSQKDEIGQASSLNLISLGYQQLGKWEAANTTIRQSLQLLTNHPQQSAIFAQALNIQGQLQLVQGKAEAALNTWKQAETIYTQLKDETGKIGSLLNQAQALQALGLYQQELHILTQLKELLETQPDSLVKAETLIALGNAWQRIGEIEKSRTVLQESRELSQRINAPEIAAKSLLALGNTARTAEDNQAALQFYVQAANIKTSPFIKVQAQLNQLSLLLDEFRITSASNLYPTIQNSLSELPLGRNSLFAKINFAESLMRLRENTSKGAADWSEIANLLKTTIEQAKSLGDRRSEAYALGRLGSLYEMSGKLTDAQDLTQQALLKAQALNDTDIAYKWHWQLGRIFQANGKIPDAIAAYNDTILILKSLRRDLVSANTEVQFSFKKNVEPVYRELINLLLTPTANNQPTQDNLNEVLALMESLQLAELDNFFGDTCSETVSSSSGVSISQVDPTAAIIYPIILPDRLEIILSLPGKPLRHYSTSISQDKLRSVVTQLRRSLLKITIGSSRKDEILALSQQLYNWLIKPTEMELDRSEAKTLVFVLDGVLRNVPMSVLYDGKQYLLEKYAIALSPSQYLQDRTSFSKEHLKALTAGLSESRHGFPALPSVVQELQQIQTLISTEQLLNQDFTTEAIQKKLKLTAFPIIHLATHGSFSSKAQNTFILTWDGFLNIKDLEQILKDRQRSKFAPIQLLVFSACQTAEGDDRAALGIAGMAVRSGASSTVASLWSVSDEATAILMTQFYHELANHENKAIALHNAQLSLLQNPQFQHPFFWAAFVLVGNWL